LERFRSRPNPAGGEEIRRVRAVVGLERIGTPEVRRALAALRLTHVVALLFEEGSTPLVYLKRKLILLKHFQQFCSEFSRPIDQGGHYL
jgi:hypothetical protein